MTQEELSYEDLQSRLADAERLIESLRTQLNTERPPSDSEEKLRSILNTAADFILTLDLDGQVLDLNRSVPGRDREEVIGTSAFDYEDRPALRAAMDRVRETSSVYEFENRAEGPHGTVAWYSCRLGPMYQDGKLAGFTMCGTDITERKRLENSLEQQAAVLRSVLDSMDNAVFVVDPDGKVVLWNPAAEDILHSDLSGRWLEEFAERYTVFLPDAMTPVAIDDWPLSRALRGEHVAYHECLIRDDERRVEFWINCHARPLADESGKVTGAVVVFRDISERKDAEASLRKSEQRFREIAENAREWIWETDANGMYTYSSPMIEQILGYRPEEIVDKLHYFDLFHPDYREQQTEGARRVFAERGRFNGFLNINLHKDGRVVWLSTSGVPRFDRGGNLIGYRGSDSDITERKQAEEEIRAGEERFRTLIETAADAIVSIDSHGIIQSANRAGERIFGYSREELLGANVSCLMPPPHCDQHDEYMARYLRTNEAKIIGKGRELIARRKNGEQFPIRLSVGEFRQGGQVYFTGIVQDITERQLAERQRELLIGELEARNDEMERFSYTVSHDLKSPLITIQGFLGLVVKDVEAGDFERMRHDVKRINDAAQKMERLLNDLLELSRMGHVVSPPVELGLSELVHEAIGLVRGKIEARGVDIELSQTELTTVFGDRPRLVEVFQNLIDNAVQYMGDQPNPRIEVGVRRDGEQAVYYVRDNGMGIEPRHHEKIFGLFDRLSPEANGTGIGLALVKRIVEMHAGRVWVESEGRGLGSTFCFTIPRREERASYGA